MHQLGCDCERCQPDCADDEPWYPCEHCGAYGCNCEAALDELAERPTLGVSGE